MNEQPWASPEAARDEATLEVLSALRKNTGRKATEISGALGAAAVGQVVERMKDRDESTARRLCELLCTHLFCKPTDDAPRRFRELQKLIELNPAGLARSEMEHLRRELWFPVVDGRRSGRPIIAAWVVRIEKVLPGFTLGAYACALLAIAGGLDVKCETATQFTARRGLWRTALSLARGDLPHK